MSYIINDVVDDETIVLLLLMRKHIVDEYN